MSEMRYSRLQHWSEELDAWAWEVTGENPSKLIDALRTRLEEAEREIFAVTGGKVGLMDGVWCALDKIKRLETENAALRTRLAEMTKAEKELSDAYLRIRQLVGAWNTKPGGVDRFEVTENAIKALRTQLEEMKSILRQLEWSHMHDYSTGWPSCPVCKGIKPGHGADAQGNLPTNSGHHQDCKLAKILNN